MQEKFKRPFSVLVVIHTPDLKILLLERKDAVGFWQSVTGSLQRGENLLETAKREVLEETGLDINLHPEYLLKDWETSWQYKIYERWQHRYASGITYNTEHVFSLCVPQLEEIIIAPKEHTRYEWVEWSMAAQRVFSPSNQLAIEQLAHASVC